LVHLTKNCRQKESEGEVVQWSVLLKMMKKLGLNINFKGIHFIHSVEIKFWTKNENKALIDNCLTSIYTATKIITQILNTSKTFMNFRLLQKNLRQ